MHERDKKGKEIKFIMKKREAIKIEKFESTIKKSGNTILLNVQYSLGIIS